MGISTFNKPIAYNVYIKLCHVSLVSWGFFPKLLTKLNISFKVQQSGEYHEKILKLKSWWCEGDIVLII